MALTLDDISAAGEAVGLSRRLNELKLIAAPTLELTPTHKTVVSKLGGLPNLASHIEWPIWKEKPLSFICQISLNEVATAEASKLLPRFGVLFFFYSAEQETWGFDPQDKGSWRVLYSEVYEDNVRSAPNDLSMVFAEMPVSFVQTLTLPSTESASFSQLRFRGKEEERYHELLEKLGYGEGCIERSLFLGHPDQIQGDMQEECAVVSGGLYAGDGEYVRLRRYKELRKSANTWRLLLQVASHQSIGMEWGDVGCLYYWIPEEAMAARAFDETWMMLQCY